MYFQDYEKEIKNFCQIGLKGTTHKVNIYVDCLA